MVNINSVSYSEALRLGLCDELMLAMEVRCNRDSNPGSNKCKPRALPLRYLEKGYVEIRSFSGPNAKPQGLFPGWSVFFVEKKSLYLGSFLLGVLIRI